MSTLLASAIRDDAGPSLSQARPFAGACLKPKVDKLLFRLPPYYRLTKSWTNSWRTVRVFNETRMRTVPQPSCHLQTQHNVPHNQRIPRPTGPTDPSNLYHHQLNVAPRARMRTPLQQTRLVALSASSAKPVLPFRDRSPLPGAQPAGHLNFDYRSSKSPRSSRNAQQVQRRIRGVVSTKS